MISFLFDCICLGFSLGLTALVKCGTFLDILEEVVVLVVQHASECKGSVVLFGKDAYTLPVILLLFI